MKTEIYFISSALYLYYKNKFINWLEKPSCRSTEILIIFICFLIVFFLNLGI